MSYNLTQPVFVSTRNDVDEKFRVANDTERDALITGDLIKRGHIIYHETDQKHYWLQTYPTFGSTTGVVWTEFGSGGGLSQFKGVHADETALNSAHPSANAGDFAINEATDTVWIWDADAGPAAWVDSGANSSIAVLDVLTSTSTTSALSANQGRVLKDLIDVLTSDKLDKTADIVNSGAISDIPNSGFFTVTADVTGMPESSIFLVTLSKYAFSTQKVYYAYAIASGKHYVGVGASTINWTEIFSGTSPSLKNPSTVSVDSDLVFDLDTFDFDSGTTLNANITSLRFENGVVGKEYTIRFIQGVNGGTLTVAQDWVKNTSYVVDDRRFWINSNDGNTDYYVVQKCNSNHNSNDSGIYGNPELDDANWDEEIYVKGEVKPILTNVEGRFDLMHVKVLASGVYRFRMDY